jgi:hypothetical protein
MHHLFPFRFLFVSFRTFSFSHICPVLRVRIGIFGYGGPGIRKFNFLIADKYLTTYLNKEDGEERVN